MNPDDQTKPKEIVETTLEDNSRIAIEIYGEGPALLLPVNPHPIEGVQAEQLRQYGADPALGQSLIQGLQGIVRVVAFDYEGHLWQKPKPQTLTPTNVVKDFLAIADAVGADRFAYYGYSWLAMVGLQFAIRADRLSALIMGGFPPINGPYKEMLQVTTAAYNMAGGDPTCELAEDDEWSTAGLGKDQTQQYMTLYAALQDFDDSAIQAEITCPRLCFVGSTDKMQYGENWGNVLVDLAGPIVDGQEELKQLGWDVYVLDGLDHMQAMQANAVLPIIQSWLAALDLSKGLRMKTSPAGDTR